MDIIGVIILVLFYVMTPLGVLWLCNRWSLLSKIGAIILVYAVGLVIGLLGLIPDANTAIMSVQENLQSITIVLSIPMMLFSADMTNWSYKKTIKIVLIGILSVIVISFIGSIMFYSLLNHNSVFSEEFYKISGVLVGVYTGGTPNLAALKIMLGMSEEVYTLVYSYDMVVCLVYILFLLLVGIRLFRFLLNGKTKDKNEVIVVNKGLPLTKRKVKGTVYDDGAIYRNLVERRTRKTLYSSFCISVVITAVALGLSFLFSKEIQVVVIMLSVTTLGIAVSFIKRVKRLRRSFDLGIYLVLVFSLIVATMVDLETLFIKGNLIILGYISFVIFGSLLLHIIFSKIFKIDADTSIIASVALINAPPFVPMIAAAMHNKDVVVTGLTVGVIGYAAGNYLGYIVAKITEHMLSYYS